ESLPLSGRRERVSERREESRVDPERHEGERRELLERREEPERREGERRELLERRKEPKRREGERRELLERRKEPKRRVVTKRREEPISERDERDDVIVIDDAEKG